MNIAQLGFGTAPILGRLDKTQSLTALTAAFAMGIRHFDTARSYGWGEAESLVGSFLANQPRESYTLVSKCGIVPVRRSPFMSVAKKVGRQVLKLLPSSHGVLRRVASSPQFQPARTYALSVLEQSVEQSLHELKTSYLDVLLLHNFEPEREGLPEVISFFRQLQRSGRIRRFGFSIEGDLYRGLACLEHHGALADGVVQAPVSQQLLALPAAWKTASFVAHSPFRFMSATPPDSPASSMRALLERLAECCQCETLVMSMFSERHMLENLRAQRAAVENQS